ncbi:biotin/lipoyl-containing protein [Micromonospora sp. R77]|uniref:biotin/lipoyl-containing protein n=1 Tax=Micromonospora sp. R77 TaxID=2925836 RepID=UPI0027DEE680|nr:biotin/lipoyl-containing protein [Micromonospora sp. R77]
MDELRHFNLPDVGEGLTEAEILTWHVRPGDPVTVNQVVVEIETAKAAVELPSPFAGRVAELLVAEGATVPVGTPLIAVTVDRPQEQPVEAPADVPAELVGAVPHRAPALVGYGSTPGVGARPGGSGASTGPGHRPGRATPRWRPRRRPGDWPATSASTSPR